MRGLFFVQCFSEFGRICRFRSGRPFDAGTGGFAFGAFNYNNVGGFGGNQRVRAVAGGGNAMVDFSSSDGNGAAAQLRLAAGGLFDVLSFDVADLSGDPRNTFGSGALFKEVEEGGFESGDRIDGGVIGGLDGGRGRRGEGREDGEGGGDEVKTGVVADCDV